MNLYRYHFINFVFTSKILFFAVELNLRKSPFTSTYIREHILSCCVNL